MTDEGFSNRIYAVEWGAELWRRNGVPVEQCEQMMRHCTEVVESDYYGFPRPETADEWSKIMETYFDRLFTSPHRGPVSFE